MSTGLCSVTSYQNSIRTYELVHNLSLDTGSCPELCGILRNRRSPRVHACDREDEFLEDVAPVWVSAVRPCRAPALGRRPPRWAPGKWAQHTCSPRAAVCCAALTQEQMESESARMRPVRWVSGGRCDCLDQRAAALPAPPLWTAAAAVGTREIGAAHARARVALPCAVRHPLGNRRSRRVHASVR